MCGLFQCEASLVPSSVLQAWCKFHCIVTNLNICLTWICDHIPSTTHISIEHLLKAVQGSWVKTGLKWFPHSSFFCFVEVKEGSSPKPGGLSAVPSTADSHFLLGALTSETEELLMSNEQDFLKASRQDCWSHNLPASSKSLSSEQHAPGDSSVKPSWWLRSASLEHSFASSLPGVCLWGV